MRLKELLARYAWLWWRMIGTRVERELVAICARRNLPVSVVSDNGTGRTSTTFLGWSQAQNAFGEGLDERLHDGWLNETVFKSLRHVQTVLSS